MDFPRSVASRLEYIEFLIQFRGYVSRIDLMDSYGIKEAAATRDFKLYNEISLGLNMEMNKASKRWELNAETFEPCFELSAQTALSKLRNSSISKAVGLESGVEAPNRLSLPKVEILSTITRAIANKTAVEIEYVAASRSGKKIQISPHAIVDNGIRWHVRAYDRVENRYWDFVLGRIKAAQNMKELISPDEGVNGDIQWNRKVKLILMPHPNKENLQNRESILCEYGMDENGEREVYVRAAVAGYWLRLWNVDCSKEHSGEGKHYQLCLKNPETLYDVSSAAIAPEFDSHLVL
ncbi:WYL domain-containing protein [Oceanospirillum sp.]|uniref:WYL domain-containing protein n=1 Tax=Oceanospirillum sp. TaxID=2021254 RepID=UPI003A90B5DE